MTLQMWGVLLGLSTGIGLLLVLSRVLAMRRADLAVRVLPYIRDLPQARRLDTPDRSSSAAKGVFGPLLRHAADTVERVVGGAASVRRRLERAAIDKTVHEFRVEQVVWGLVAFGVTAAWAVARAITAPGSSLALAIFCACAFAFGVILRDNRLSAAVRERERMILVEFPVVAELLALAVAAGESPVAALGRVVRRSHGALSKDLEQVLAEIRTGASVGQAFDDLAARTGLALVSRFAEGIAVATERGTPISDVLHAQAGDVREAGRRELIESGARKEVLMMVPVVFLVMPVTVVFAFYPGVIGLSLVTP